MTAEEIKEFMNRYELGDGVIDGKTSPYVFYTKLRSPNNHVLTYFVPKNADKIELYKCVLNSLETFDAKEIFNNNLNDYLKGRREFMTSKEVTALKEADNFFTEKAVLIRRDLGKEKLFELSNAGLGVRSAEAEEAYVNKYGVDDLNEKLREVDKKEKQNLERSDQSYKKVKSR